MVATHKKTRLKSDLVLKGLCLVRREGRHKTDVRAKTETSSYSSTRCGDRSLRSSKGEGFVRASVNGGEAGRLVAAQKR